MTKLEQVVLSVLGLRWLEELKKGDRLEIQSKLDDLTPDIIGRLNDSEICVSTRQVYDETAAEYEKNPHTRKVIPELPEFMEMVPDKALVLDMGCGHGRDTLFMSLSDPELRRSLMKNPGQKPPDKTFSVVAVDGSIELLSLAEAKYARAVDERGSSRCESVAFINRDMHSNQGYERMFGKNFFRGIWSCAALFTHTPESHLDQTLSGMAKILTPGGIFFTSYTQQEENGRYNKLLLSSTGRIKWFSHPQAEQITNLAAQNGLRLLKSRYSDFEQKGHPIQKNLFVSQFFIKE